METQTDKKTSSQKPLKTVRRGAIAAHIWQRQSQTGFVYYDFSLSRSWKSTAAGREGYSNNFFADNDEDLVGVINDAADEIRRLLENAETVYVDAA